jgi:lipopolysaccharide biosynthesis glycosyltransferase
MEKELIIKRRKYTKKIKKKRKKSLYIKELLKIFLIIIIFLFCMKKYYHKIHIALNIDKKYLYQSLVFITSLLENRNSTTIYEIHILASQKLILEHKNKSQILLKKYGEKYLNISYINMSNDFSGALTGPYISTAAYYRIALPSLLPYVDRIIYCDSDVIDFKDLTEMYKLKLDNNTYLK